MSRISADNILWTLGIFAILLIAYGSSIQNVDVQGNFNTIFANWPTFGQTVQAATGPQRSCSPVDFGCQASAGVAQATGYLAAVLSYPTILGYSILARINAFGNLIQFETFGSTAAFGTIGPFGLLFFGALALVVVIEVVRIVRGSPSGL